ncbi:UNVERIFIED_CONTAM: hypothetical protein PYX00_000385 [Menopon gallinae]|uniref:Signal recognition particle subunit SRP68 n=1 Tax=Menopon gallinae TaxID=328185 RepID=A0AAW2IAB2_9NEOP
MVVAESCDNEVKVNENEIKNSNEVKTLTLSVEILKIIKEAQQQHGLRHSDYQRYRCYCSRRIRRLRKVLKVTQGDRRHFKRRDVTEAMLKDERYLYIPLFMAERAWAYAMQLRQEANTEPRRKFHLIQRLRKAAAFSLHLQHLCESDVCDARTKLEAQAYVAWIHGSLHFELQLWKPAMENLKKAQMVYEKLAEALNEEDSATYRSRVDELTPSLRYCSYNIGDESAMEDLLAMRTQAQGDLLANFDALMEKTRRKNSEALEEIEWRGRTVQIRPERVRRYLLSNKQLNSALLKASNIAAKIELIESNLMDCKDAIASLRDELKGDASSKTVREKGQPLSSLQYLLSYLTYIRLTRSIERNLMLVEQIKTKENINESKDKKMRPQDLPRLYEIILQNLLEMQQLSGTEDDAKYQHEVETKIKVYKAFRCFYIAEYLVTLKKWTEAMALYQRSEQYISGTKNASEELKKEIADLQAAVEGSKFSAHAHYVLEGEGQEEDNVAVKQPKEKKPLIERLDIYYEDPSLLTKNPNVLKLPPDMKPIPCKPLFFDLALNFAEFPSLEHKMDTAGKKQGPGLTGFVKGLWGWGGKK